METSEPPAPSAEGLIEMATAEDETQRMTAVRSLGDRSLNAEELTLLRTLSKDPSRSVRMAALDTLQALGLDENTYAKRQATLRQSEWRSGVLLAATSLGSAGTGLLITTIAIGGYYATGKFPFPSPISVLAWVNGLLTLPFITMALLFLLPGQSQRRAAALLAVTSLLGAIAATVGLQWVFMNYWAPHFSTATQNLYYHLLTPFRVSLLVLPLVLGQLLTLYFLRLYGREDR